MERQKLLLQMGQADTALAEQKQRYERELTEWKTKHEAAERFALQRETSLIINDGLAGVEFLSPIAATQARELIGLRCEAIRDPNTGEIVVLDKASRRPATEMINEWLASNGTHFLKPKSGPGGSPRVQQTAADQSQVQPPPAPENETFEQRVFRAWQENQGQVASNPLDWRGNIVSSARARRQQQQGK
jgi:hypothetical protein